MSVDAIFRALADPTRLRILRLLGTMELAVGEMAQVLGQSQPRVSRHVGILCDAGLAERRREGSWVFLRTTAGADAPLADAVTGLLALAEREDSEFARQCEEDRRKLASVRATRDDNAIRYFARHAEDWDDLRRLHSPDQMVEEALLALFADAPLGRVLDIGTGTGRMAELFAGQAQSIVALDKNLEMLRVARAKLQHLPAGRIELVQGDFTDLPFAADTFDTVLLHQVLHFAQDPAVALAEAARVLSPGGRIAIVDFAAHDHEELRERHAHARLGFAEDQMQQMLRDNGFAPETAHALDGGELVVKIWLATRSAPTIKTDIKTERRAG